MSVLTEQSHHFVAPVLTPIVQMRKRRGREVDEGHGLFKQRKGCWLLSSEYVVVLCFLFCWDVDFLCDFWGVQRKVS